MGPVCRTAEKGSGTGTPQGSGPVDIMPRGRGIYRGRIRCASLGPRQEDGAAPQDGLLGAPTLWGREVPAG